MSADTLPLAVALTTAGLQPVTFAPRTLTGDEVRAVCDADLRHRLPGPWLYVRGRALVSPDGRTVRIVEGRAA